MYPFPKTLTRQPKLGPVGAVVQEIPFSIRTKSTRCHHRQPPCRNNLIRLLEPKIPLSMHRSLARLGSQHWVSRVAGSASHRIRFGGNVVLRGKKGGGEKKKQQRQQHPKTTTTKDNNNQRPKRGGRITQNPSGRSTREVRVSRRGVKRGKRCLYTVVEGRL